MPDSARALIRDAQRDLRRSALAALALAACLLLAGAAIAVARRQFSAAYPLKCVLLFVPGALLVLRALPRRHPFSSFGPANAVTLGRGVLVCLLAGLIGESAAAGSWLAGDLALLVILLDGVDGALARRHGTASPFGARFDMETDAVFVAVLAVLAWQSGKVGAWVLASGAMRYLFAAAALLVPLLRRPLPAGYRGKSIAVLQMLALVAVLAPPIPSGAATATAALALALLTLSFLLDIVWQLRHRPRAPAQPPAASALE